MFLDEDERRRARQEMLEAFTSGIGGPACAPMPGIMLEMLEIAAMERRQSRGPSEPMPLTFVGNGSGMTAPLLRMGKTVIDVARWLRSGLRPRRLPA
jgi:hypothetical protein